MATWLHEQPSPPNLIGERRGQQLANMWRKERLSWAPGNQSDPETGARGEREVWERGHQVIPVSEQVDGSEDRTFGRRRAHWGGREDGEGGPSWSSVWQSLGMNSKCQTHPESPSVPRMVTKAVVPGGW